MLANYYSATLNEDVFMGVRYYIYNIKTVDYGCRVAQLLTSTGISEFDSIVLYKKNQIIVAFNYSFIN